MGERSICPRAPAEGALKGGVIIFLQKFCELRGGRDGHGRTNYVRRTMHILDLISSFSNAKNAPKSLAAGTLPQTY